MSNVVYLNGKYLHQDKATISVMDRGFLFGDGVYEVIPVYNSKIFRFDQHIDRLHRSLAAIALKCDYSKADWKDIFEQLLVYNQSLGANQSIYLQITRGPDAIRNHAFPKQVTATIFAFSFPLKPIPYEKLAQGLAVMTLEDTRWARCNIKSISLLANVLLYQEALDHSNVEAILIRNGLALEGATSNVFIVKNNILKTPPLSDFILGGITRDLVLELAKTISQPVEEVAITKHELKAADEVWITSSTREIYPIMKVDDTPIGKGSPGPIWQKLINAYREFIKNI